MEQILTPSANPADRVQRFSTAGLGVDRRITLWEEHNAQTLVGLSARTLDEAGLEATETTLALEHLRLGHVAANAHVVERSVVDIAKTPASGIALYFALAGESFFYHRHGVLLQRPGGVVVCDTDEPFMRGFARGLREFVLTVPRSLFDELSDATELERPLTFSFASIAGENAHAAALAALLRSSLSARVSSIGAIEQTAIGLIRALFASEVTDAAGTHFHAAMSHIERHLRSPRLSVGEVARAVHLSERQLARIFADSGAGVARVILERRLDLAHQILSSGQGPAINEVAAQCGFSSHAHFTRTNRVRFDETPAHTRARAAARPDFDEIGRPRE